MAYIIIEHSENHSETYEIDCEDEVKVARRAMREAGIACTQVYVGSPDCGDAYGPDRLFLFAAPTYLYLYHGPGGPITKQIDFADDLDEAVKIAERDYRRWYDEASDDLDLAPGAEYDDIIAALEDQGWNSSPVYVADGQWSIFKWGEM